MNDFESQLIAELKAIREAINNLAASPLVVTDVKPVVTNTDEETTAMAVNQPTHIDEMILQNTPQSSVKKQLVCHYFGAPDGRGFEQYNELYDVSSPKILYVIESDDGVNGRFYPLASGLPRFRNNADSLLYTMCELTKSLDEINELVVTPENYGEILLNNGYWEVVKKCVI